MHLHSPCDRYIFWSIPKSKPIYVLMSLDNLSRVIHIYIYKYISYIYVSCMCFCIYVDCISIYLSIYISIYLSIIIDVADIARASSSVAPSLSSQLMLCGSSSHGQHSPSTVRATLKVVSMNLWTTLSFGNSKVWA